MARQTSTEASTEISTQISTEIPTQISTETLTDLSLADEHFQTVDVLVGLEQVPFPIHPYAIWRSSVLQEANREGPDDDNVILRLPNESPKIFDNYCYWMYQHCDSHPDEDLKSYSMTLFQTHGLAIRLGNPTMANEIMDHIVHRWDKEGGCPDLCMLKYLFGDEVEKSSPLRRWAAEVFGPCMDAKIFDIIADFMPKELLIHVAQKLRQSTERYGWTFEPLTSYHLPVPQKPPRADGLPH